MLPTCGWEPGDQRGIGRNHRWFLQVDHHGRYSRDCPQPRSLTNIFMGISRKQGIPKVKIISLLETKKMGILYFETLPNIILISLNLNTNEWVYCVGSSSSKSRETRIICSPKPVCQSAAQELPEEELGRDDVACVLRSFRHVRCSYTFYPNPSHHHLNALRFWHWLWEFL